MGRSILAGHGPQTPVTDTLLVAQAVAGITVAVAAVIISPPLWGAGLDVVDAAMVILRAYGPEIKGVVVVGWTGYSASLFGVTVWREIAKLWRR